MACSTEYTGFGLCKMVPSFLMRRAIGVSTLVLAAGVLLAQPSGDPANGKTIFDGRGACMNCHRIEGNGSHFGPDLSEVGGRSPEQLETSILDPDAEIAPADRIILVVLKNRTTTIRRLLNEDTFGLQMIDKTERLSFKDKLTAQEVADVVAYLGTFKPPPGPSGRGGARGGAQPALAAH